MFRERLTCASQKARLGHLACRCADVSRCRQWACHGLAIPLTAGFLVLIAPGLVPSTGRQVDGRDIRAVLLLYVGVVAALYFAFRCLPSSERWGFSSAMPAA